MAEKLSKGRNNVEKGENTIYGEFVLFPHCFQKTSNADMEKQGLVWGRVKVTLKTLFGNYMELDLHVQTTPVT